MNVWKSVLPGAVKLFVLYTLLCGVLYTVLITCAAQIFFPQTADGSLIVKNGKTYGMAAMGQPFTNPGYLWGRIMQLDVSTYKDEQGQALLYAGPSNLSPASDEYKKLVAERVERLQATNPVKADTPIPVDLVTGSASGLDPDISPAAAAYQIPRIAKARGIPEQEVQDIISHNTTGRFLGIFGEPTVNVLKVNLALDEK